MPTKEEKRETELDHVEQERRATLEASDRPPHMLIFDPPLAA